MTKNEELKALNNVIDASLTCYNIGLEKGKGFGRAEARAEFRAELMEISKRKYAHEYGEHWAVLALAEKYKPTS